MNRDSFAQYKQTLRMGYLAHGIPFADIENSFPSFEEIAGWASPERVVAELLPTAERRLSHCSAAFSGQLFNAGIRRLDVGMGEILIPIMNSIGQQWYGSSGIDNYDFIGESRFGLLDDAKVIYDLGGHQGVWSAYYGKFTGAHTVYSFEPSLVNVEISAILHLINRLSNIVIIAAAVAANSPAVEREADEMQVDIVPGAEFRLVDFADFAIRRANFIKIDIEGYEYDLITKYPWILGLADNFHIELHVPRLQERDLDYRDVLDQIPFRNFDVCLYSDLSFIPISQSSCLSGYCSLMLKKK